MIHALDFLAGLALGATLGVQGMLWRHHRFYDWAIREARDYFDQLCRELIAEQERISEPPDWFPSEECER